MAGGSGYPLTTGVERVDVLISLMAAEHGSPEIREWAKRQIINLALSPTCAETLKFMAWPSDILGVLKGHADFQRSDIAVYFEEAISVLLQDPDFPRKTRNVYGNLSTVTDM